jgi:hypothetical protein
MNNHLNLIQVTTLCVHMKAVGNLISMACCLH